MRRRCGKRNAPDRSKHNGLRSAGTTCLKRRLSKPPSYCSRSFRIHECARGAAFLNGWDTTSSSLLLLRDHVGASCSPLASQGEEAAPSGQWRTTGPSQHGGLPARPGGTASRCNAALREGHLESQERVGHDRPTNEIDRRLCGRERALTE